MIIGFTGSRQGLRVEQILAIRGVLIAKGPSFVIHGDCIGGDADFHKIASNLLIPIKLRPCVLQHQRAFCIGAYEICDPEAPLSRNHKIVDECDELIAAPYGPEKLRSGTWATIRYARKMGRPHWLV